MDPMDIDDTFDVPDTPTRLVTRGIDGRRCATEEHHLSTPCHSGHQKFIGGAEDRPVVIDSGSRGPTLRPQRSSPSFIHGNLFRRGMSDNPHYISQNSSHGRQLPSMRPLSISNPSSKEDSFVDLGDRSLHRPVPDKSSFSGVRKHDRVEFPKRSGLTDGNSSKSMTKFLSISHNSSKETGSVNGVGPSVGHQEGADFVSNGKIESSSGDFPSLNSFSPPNVNRQKRLVRNGCISPNNIAKGKQLAQKNINGSEDVANNNNSSVASSSPANPIDIRDLVAEDNGSYTCKGKGLMTYPHSSKGHDTRSKNLVGRSTTNSKERNTENGDAISHVGNSTEERGGWRSTRARSRGIYISSSANGEQHSVGETDGSRGPTQHQDSNNLERKGNETRFSVGSDRPDIRNMVSHLHIPPETSTESMHYPRGRSGQLNRPHSTADSYMKRQRQGSISKNCADSSTSVSDDPEIVYLSSPPETANPRCISRTDNLQRIIEVDELSPPSRHNTPDEDDRARQVEEDERLARELQEQLYNEFPVFGISEDDHIPLDLRWQDGSNHGVFRRGSSTTNMPRQSQSRPFSNALRRGSLSRGAASGRMSRPRSRLAGQPRPVLPSRGASLFPSDMDVDMRMHILGALEEFNDLAAPGGFIRFEHDFNENDYEMLLALDENNDHHRGASSHHINSLPQSIVQNDNFGEACVICLETPTNGDTIRHLPCLHKFHKDCIDEWLRRRKSCPVCKSSIT